MLFISILQDILFCLADELLDDSGLSIDADRAFFFNLSAFKKCRGRFNQKTRVIWKMCNSKMVGGVNLD